MRVCALSDVHGQFDGLNIKECDVLFICGDIVPLRMQRNIPQSFSWFKKTFVPWCLDQPVDQIYMVWGNHDFVGEKIGQECKEFLQGTNITILDNEQAEYLDEEGKIWTIWGSPLCHIFGNWAFMYSDDFEREKFSLMPNKFDFLITHDAAFERSDQCLGFMSPSERELHRGNIALKEILEGKRPENHFFGHLHTCNHELKEYKGTMTACVSLLNEQYERVFDPLYLEV